MHTCMFPFLGILFSLSEISILYFQFPKRCRNQKGPLKKTKQRETETNINGKTQTHMLSLYKSILHLLDTRKRSGKDQKWQLGLFKNPPKHKNLIKWQIKLMDKLTLSP
ncbi:hypothetical protein V6Z11_A11G208700 [Gossypium hirsutum]